jgi:hypothetical protein
MADVTVRRIRFVAEPAAGTILRRFTQPRKAAAVVVDVDVDVELSRLPMDQGAADAGEELLVIVAPATLPPELRKKVDGWLSPEPVVLKLKSGTLRWRPGRAVLERVGVNSGSLLNVLIDFAFFEGELRRLEQELLPYQESAPADVALAYRIRKRDHAQWARLGGIMEALSVLRLTFARLELARAIDREGRRAGSALMALSGVRGRLESFSNRLEACEDLYEGAVDRITDFRWYRKGEILETVIVVLLVLEVILMAWQLWPRL